MKQSKFKLDKEGTYWLIGGVAACTLIVVAGKGVADGFSNQISPEMRAQLEQRVDPSKPPPGYYEAMKKFSGPRVLPVEPGAGPSGPTQAPQ